MTEKRRPLTRREFGFLIIKQDCLCGCGCGQRLDFTKPKLVTDEHLNSLFSGGKNELENRALWLSECSKPKTSAEAPDRAKVRRIEQGKTQADKRAQKKAEGRHKPIVGRGFAGSKKFNGEVTWK
jgi:hypothetical protein